MIDPDEAPPEGAIPLKNENKTATAEERKRERDKDKDSRKGGE